jgi:hypothetical protein
MQNSSEEYAIDIKKVKAHGPNFKNMNKRWHIYTMASLNVIKEYNNLIYDRNSQISVITVKPMNCRIRILFQGNK